jgi:hypothetical protein
MSDWLIATHKTIDGGDSYQLSRPTIECQTHGQHSHYIRSYIQGHEGVWCQLCALEKLGPQARWVGDRDE